VDGLLKGGKNEVSEDLVIINLLRNVQMSFY